MWLILVFYFLFQVISTTADTIYLDMWLILVFYFLFQVISTTAVAWDVFHSDVEFGTNVTLKCRVQKLSILQRLDQHPTWKIKGLTDVQCYNEHCSDDGKYSMIVKNHTQSFYLVIHNFSETDLNTNYSCSFGFKTSTKNLTDDNIFLFYKPAENSTIDNTFVDKENVHINITVSEVYPVPSCSVAITTLNEEVISVSTLDVTALDVTRYRKKVVLLGVVHTGLEECERRMVVDCCLNVLLVTILKRNITVCQESQVKESPAQLNITVIAIVIPVVIVVFSIALVIRSRDKLCRYMPSRGRIPVFNCAEMDTNVTEHILPKFNSTPVNQGFALFILIQAFRYLPCKR